MAEPHRLLRPDPMEGGSRENQAGEGLERNCLLLFEQNPSGLLGTKVSLCLPILVGNKLQSASLTFPEFQGAGSNSC